MSVVVAVELVVAAVFVVATIVADVGMRVSIAVVAVVAAAAEVVWC